MHDNTGTCTVHWYMYIIPDRQAGRESPSKGTKMHSSLSLGNTVEPGQPKACLDKRLYSDVASRFLCPLRV